MSSTVLGAYYALSFTPPKIYEASIIIISILLRLKYLALSIGTVGIIAKGRKLWCPGAQALTSGEGLYCEMSG